MVYAGGYDPYVTSAPAANNSALSPYAFGAKGDGATDDTDALQRCIDAALGGPSSAGVSNVRTATRRIDLGDGQFLITRPLKIYSSIGFTMEGTGEGTAFVVLGNMQTPIDVNGALKGRFANFLIIGYSGALGTGSVTNGFQLDWDPAIAARSTEHNVIERVTIRNLQYVNGFAVGVNSANRDVAINNFIDCSVQGAWATGNVTTYQAGFRVGSGVFANILDNYFFGCYSVYNANNYYVDHTSGFGVYGGAVGEGGNDFTVYTQSNFVISGVRSENSQRFLAAPPFAIPATITIADCSWDSDQTNADGQIIQWGNSGCLHLDNFAIVDWFNTYTPTIRVLFQADIAASIPQVIVTGGYSKVAATALVTGGANGQPFMATVVGYTQMNTSTGQTLGTTSRVVYNQKGIVDAAPSVQTVTANYTLATTDDLIIGNGASLSITLPDPTTTSKRYSVKNINASSLTVVGTIDGVANLTLTQWGKASFRSTGTAWITV